MNASQFARWLKARGVEVISKKGTGHRRLVNPANGRRSEMPWHGGSKQLKPGLMAKIRKDLGLE